FFTRKHLGRSGTGLGLAVVWGTVQDHHGHIEVHRRPDRGTAFTLFLPASREALSVDDSASQTATSPGRGQTIVVVDDMAEQIDLVVLILRRLNYRPVAFSSGEAAVAYLRDNEADLVLLDMIMDPGMDGLDTYRQIIKIRPQIKALVASGYSETDRVREAIRLGVGAYIKKPYTLEEIGRAIKAELG
ncbi:MAG: response regulator, partial [Desulfosarcinaceae bacterium]